MKDTNNTKAMPKRGEEMLLSARRLKKSYRPRDCVLVNATPEMVWVEKVLTRLVAVPLLMGTAFMAPWALFTSVPQLVLVTMVVVWSGLVALTQVRYFAK